MATITRSTPSPGVLLLQLNRPKVNAFNTALFVSLKEAFDEADEDETVRVVVLASALEKGFTAGLDLTCVFFSSSSDRERRFPRFRLRRLLVHSLRLIHAATPPSTIPPPTPLVLPW
jgi:enoyl-CoA hydratase/carnithine racemase